MFVIQRDDQTTDDRGRIAPGTWAGDVSRPRPEPGILTPFQPRPDERLRVRKRPKYGFSLIRGYGKTLIRCLFRAVNCDEKRLATAVARPATSCLKARNSCRKGRDSCRKPCDSCGKARDSGCKARDNCRKARNSCRNGRNSCRRARDSCRSARNSCRSARNSSRAARDSSRKARHSRLYPFARQRKGE